MEVSAEEWERDRLLITGLDLAQATSYLDLLQLRERRDPLPDDYALRPRWFEEKIVREALIMAALICYIRPFTLQKDRGGKREPRGHLRWIVDELSDEDRRLHDWILAARNGWLAHSDAQHYAQIPFGDGYLFGGAEKDPIFDPGPDLFLRLRRLLKVVEKAVGYRLGYIDSAL